MPAQADLPRLGVDLRGPLNFQLFGSFVFTADGLGQAFNGLPDIPISKFILQFKKDGLLINSQEPMPTARTRLPGQLRGLERRHTERQGRRHRSGLRLSR